jgi:GT2 family glycosyltransferase
MNPPDYAVTFACYNQLEYTRLCVDSLLRHGLDLRRLVVVDNGSSDGTRAYLQTLPLGACIFNRGNLGCGVAWNQGALALQAEWTVVMNNDVVVSAGWLDALIADAERHQLKIVSPSLIEGALDYDFDAFAVDAGNRMKDALRLGAPHAVCMAIHDSVWQEIGYFRAEPKLLGFEDTLFFDQVKRAGIPAATLGSSWLHHFGSITQKAMKQERGLSGKQGLGLRTNYRLLGYSFLQRRVNRYTRKQMQREWRATELDRFGMTMHGVRENGAFNWL